MTKSIISSSIITFSENTKSVFTLTTIALILIVSSTLFSQTETYRNNSTHGMKLALVSLKTIGCIILGFAFYINYKETNKLYANIPTMFSNSDYKGLRNNTILSYGLCFMLFTLFLYIFYTSLF